MIPEYYINVFVVVVDVLHNLSEVLLSNLIFVSEVVTFQQSDEFDELGITKYDNLRGDCHKFLPWIKGVFINNAIILMVFPDPYPFSSLCPLVLSLFKCCNLNNKE